MRRGRGKDSEREPMSPCPLSIASSNSACEPQGKPTRAMADHHNALAIYSPTAQQRTNVRWQVCGPRGGGACRVSPRVPTHGVDTTWPAQPTRPRPGTGAGKQGVTNLLWSTASLAAWRNSLTSIFAVRWSLSFPFLRPASSPAQLQKRRRKKGRSDGESKSINRFQGVGRPTQRPSVGPPAPPASQSRPLYTDVGPSGRGALTGSGASAPHLR